MRRNMLQFAAGTALILVVGRLAYELAWQLFSSGAVSQGLLAAACAAVLLYPAGWVVSRARGLAGHAHGGDRQTVAKHEAGHAVAARALGGRVRSAELYRNGGGLVTWDMPAKVYSAKTNVAFLLAGQYAAGTSSGCGGDRAAISQQLRAVPSGERAAVRRAAERRARQIVTRRRGEIRRVAAQLDEKGRL